ncbi:hypothetical protein, conserved [Leishmania tarentolae]|uniref:CHASE domain-containing protein n=1 Tax=Leishmania tarentolae TaxID=5689 RepID=A0A640K9H6_LEITA|nr:hypothetical protein, conserved [Leishmania tarentolae]
MLKRACAHDSGGGTHPSHHEGHGASSQEMATLPPSSQEAAELAGGRPARQGHCPASRTRHRFSSETQSFNASWQGALPKNFYIITACVVGCALTILIGILTPMLVIRRSANAHDAVLREKEYDAGSSWASVLRIVMIEGFACTRALAGFAVSVFPSLQTPIDAPDPTPIENVTEHLERFPRVASLIASKKPAVAMQYICPNGVIAATYPHDPLTVGRNLMSPEDPTNRYKPTTMEIAQSGRYAIIGPRRSTITSLDKLWVIFTRAPLYRNTSKGMLPSLETFWGFAVLLVNVTGALDVMDLDGLAKVKNLNYVLYDTSIVTEDQRVIASSLPDGTTQEEYDKFIAESTVTDVLKPYSLLHIAVRSRETHVYLSPTVIISIIVWTLLGSLLLLGISIAVVLWCTRTYDAAAHAPKLAPFAMLTIGPCRGEELWDLAADQMAEVTEKLDQILARQMERHHAYQTQQVHPLTTSYVTRSVAAAVQMAFGIIEELQRHPIDGPLRTVLGDDVRLQLCCAVHWCTDAVVRVESLEGTYRYEGGDVVFGGRMWAFAAPSVVTASEAVVQTLPQFGLSGVGARPYRTVNKKLTTRANYADDDEGGVNDAHHTTDGSGNTTLYLLVHAAKPDVVAEVEATAAASAAEAMVPQPILGKDPESSLYYGMVAPMNLPSFEARTAASSLRDVPAQSSEAEPSAPRRWACAASTRANAAVDNPLSCGDLKERSAAVTPEQSCLVPIEVDSVTRALLQPRIPCALDVALRVAFDYQSITLDVRYAEVRVLVYYFYSSYKILFLPLAAPERHNIFRRLVTAFGVPQQGILEHLAACSAVQWLSQVRKINRVVYQHESL